MKFTTIVGIAATVATPALGQGAGFPECATKAGTGLLQGANCALGDLKCTCKSAAFIKNVMEQVPKYCNAEDYATVKNTLKNVCSSVGVPITFPDDNNQPSKSASTESQSSSVSAPVSTSKPATHATTTSAVASETASAPTPGVSSGSAPASGVSSGSAPAPGVSSGSAPATGVSSGSVVASASATSPAGGSVSGFPSAPALSTKTPVASASLTVPSPSFTAGANSKQTGSVFAAFIALGVVAVM